MRNIRTDLALEACEMYAEQSNKNDGINGVEVEENKDGSITITHVKITNEDGEKALGKKCGNYITIESPDMKDGTENYERACEIVAEQIRKISAIDDESLILVAGLGNHNINPDALGPKVVEKLAVTRHIFKYMKEYTPRGMRQVCAVAPGVLGTTGIETVEIIKGIVEKVKPTLVIVIDALASRKADRISNTVQIADTGISPGAGIGNKRSGINKETLGVDVIAIGVPTVVDAATIAGDAIDLLINDFKKEIDANSHLSSIISDFENNDRHMLIQNALSENMGNLVVTPKEMDNIIDKVSSIVAGGINMAVHKDLTLEDIDGFLG